jgi:hypothetical protein
VSDNVLPWGAPSTGFVLENNSSLTASNVWATVSLAPTVVNGFNYVTNTPSPPEISFTARNILERRHPGGNVKPAKSARILQDPSPSPSSLMETIRMAGFLFKNQKLGCENPNDFRKRNASH